jgi:hypothetical protein
VTARETLQELADFWAGSPELEVAVVARGARDAAPPELRVLNLADDAEDFFRQVIETAVIEPIESGRWALKRLDLLYKPDSHEIEWSPLTEVEAVELAIDRCANLSPFAPFSEGDASYKRRMRYSVTVLTGAQNRQAFFFRSFSERAELERKRGAALLARDGTFRLVKDRIFLFDEAIDAFAFGDYLYVLRKHDYRRIFDQLATILRRAKRAARDLNAKVPIANFEAFETACTTDSRMADKILAVRGRDYFDDLSYGMLKPVIAEFNLDIPTKSANGETQLVFRTGPSDRFRILKLIDDDYLASSMTRHKYEVNSKHDQSS